MDIGGYGLSSRLALKLADFTSANQLEGIPEEARHERAIESFREKVAAITTPAEFVQDFEVYSFVMRAFDLEDQIFGKAMIRKILESDPDDSTSLLNRLTDSRFEKMHEALGFTTSSGTEIPDFSSASFQDDMVEMYVNRVYINRQAEQNTAVGAALEFREKVGKISSWYDVLSDEGLTLFFQTALSLPSSISGLDVDKQKELLEDKFDLTDLTSDSEVDDLINRYLLLNDILDTSQLFSNNVALQIIRPIYFGEQSRNFVFETINIPTVSYSASSLYRW